MTRMEPELWIWESRPTEISPMEETTTNERENIILGIDKTTDSGPA